MESDLIVKFLVALFTQNTTLLVIVIFIKPVMKLWNVS